MIKDLRRSQIRARVRLLISGALLAPMLMVVVVLPGDASAVVCGQPSHAWVATTGSASVANGSTLTVSSGTAIFPTGVIAPFQVVSFVFQNTTTGATVQHITHQARENCVVHHEPEERSAGSIGIGTFRVTATYLRWEDLVFATDHIGFLRVTQSGGGGGGGGGRPGCQPGMLCEQ
jgi:hypothetical protein